jgi:hypothetical protein
VALKLCADLNGRRILRDGFWMNSLGDRVACSEIVGSEPSMRMTLFRDTTVATRCVRRRTLPFQNVQPKKPRRTL